MIDSPHHLGKLFFMEKNVLVLKKSVLAVIMFF